MSPPSQPLLDDVLSDFIGAAIPSVWALETLLALRRPPREGWAEDRLVAEMRASTVLVNDCLVHLQRSGLVVGDGGVFHYSPASATLAALCDDLEAAYRERPVAVINTISKRRPDPLRGFADSFRLGGWKS